MKDADRRQTAQWARTQRRMGIALGDLESGNGSESAYASPADFAECRRIHRRYGATYYFATLWFPKPIRLQVHALYGFVRIPDEWVDNPGELRVEDQRTNLRNWRLQLLNGMEGVKPTHPAMRAFCDVMRSGGHSVDEPIHFLNAMEQDLEVDRYEKYEDLRHYMRGSAIAVGKMMCDMLGAPQTGAVQLAAGALGEAMQLTNFLRDVGEDIRRGRLYLPLEDLASFGVTVEDIRAERMTAAFANLMRFEIARARAFYAMADRGIPLLPIYAQRSVRMARILYSRILDRIEARHYDVFSGRARTSPLDKLQAVVSTLRN
ncbi:MAG: phytoene/squalene synthase family protein [Fimbriimonadaceae bacterium]|nr:phytoene/squalene synthase family protein [Fimbriimonadaceae bacterium]